MTDKQEVAKKAYENYKKVTSKTFLNVTTTQLNVIYNILCRINRDEEYAKALAEFETSEREPLKTLIEEYFDGYNNLFGLEIRDTLTEFTDESLASGGYFTLDTFKEESGELIPHKPTEFEAGDVATVRATLYSHETKEKISVPTLHAISVNDDGITEEHKVSDCSEITFKVTLSRAGMAKFKVIPKDASGKAIIGLEVAYGGLLFSWQKIKPTHSAPADLIPFWCSEIDRMMSVDPTSTVTDGYAGRVAYMHDMPSKNKYKLTRLDSEYIAKMRKNEQQTVSDTALDKYDLWDVNLKSPGPCPSTAYISVPKFAKDSSLPIKFVFDGYSVRCPAPMLSDSAICVHCSHHGYELGMEDKSYYEPIRKQIAGHYGRGNGEINSDYKDIHDCYMTYLIIRDLQMIRYCTDPSLSYDLPELHDKWNGEIAISGGSMGGYQTLAVGGLTALLRKVSPSFKVARLTPSIPAFGNRAAELDRRVSTDLTKYEEGCDYFDTVFLTPLIDAPVDLPRVGLGDETCPATGILAAINNIPEGIPREINFLQNSSHGYLPDIDLQTWYKYEV